MAEETGSRELVRAVGAEFDRRGWADPDDLALEITNAAISKDELDAETASELGAPAFFGANGIERRDLLAALRAVFAGRVLVEKDGSGPTFVDQSVTIGDNNTISGAINAGGNQLVLNNNTPPPELLSALTGFVASASINGFSSGELELLDRLADTRDLDPAELQQAVREGIESARPVPGRLAKFRDAVLTSATSGLAVQAIIAATGALL